MKISIIVPVHNSENTLKRCVDSILAQTFNNVEILLIENGSSDNSYDMCREYAEKHTNISCYVSSPGGVSRARNLGLKCATGDIIGFCDADDELTEGALQSVAEIFDEHPTLEIVVGGYYRVASKSKAYMGFNRSGECGIRKVIHHAIYDFRVMGAVWNKFFKRELINDVQFDESLSYCEDMCFLISVLAPNQNKNAYILSKPLYCYINNDQSVTKNLNNVFDENGQLKYINALNKILELTDLKGYARMLIKRQMFWLSIEYYNSASTVQARKTSRKYILRCFPYYLLTMFHINPKQVPRTIIVSLRGRRRK